MEITLNKAFELAEQYRQQNKYDDALKILEQCLQQSPDNKTVANNLTVTYLDAANRLINNSKFDAAISLLAHAQKVLPNNVSIVRKLSYAFALNNSPTAEIENYQKALKRIPNDTTLKLAYALSLLRQGDLITGYKYYEARLINDVQTPHPESMQEWGGNSSLKGKTISIYHEQGYGDIIAFVRYLPHIKALGASIHVFCQPTLSSLLSQLPYIDKIIEFKQQAFATDFFIHFASLPKLFNTTIDTIPADTPYLFTNAKKQEQFNQLISATAKTKVGFCWAGNPKFCRDELRSMPLKEAQPILAIKDLQFFNLHIYKDEAEIAQEPLELIHKMTDVSDHIDNFMDTACLMKNLDLIITVDTAVAHLAGALNIPCWVMIEKTWPDWRWFQDRSDSPWYPSIKLYRQKKQKDWQGVVTDILRDLTNLNRK